MPALSLPPVGKQENDTPYAHPARWRDHRMRGLVERRKKEHKPSMALPPARV